MERTTKETTDMLCETIEQLAPLVEAGLPGRNPVAFAFRKGWPYPADDQTIPDKLMIQAIQQFRRLPAEERRRICNGWVGDPTDRPTRRELEAYEASLSCRPIAMVLSVHGDMKNMYAYQQWEESNYAVPVEVKIRFGASKADVLRCLRDIEGAIRDSFEVMIANEHTFCSDLHKGLDKTASTAGKKNAAAA